MKKKTIPHDQELNQSKSQQKKIPKIKKKSSQTHKLVQNNKGAYEIPNSTMSHDEEQKEKKQYPMMKKQIPKIK